jgi:type II secretory ATPase GspE/PulE/Tfp pilus assembly ATPase PilB-like protein
MARRDSEKEQRKELSAALSVLAGEQQERLAQHRAETFALPYINLFTYPIDPDVLERIPQEIAREGNAIVFYKQGSDIRVGAVNPAQPGFAKFQETVLAEWKVEPKIYIISHRSLNMALGRYRRAHAQAAPPDDEMSITEKRLTGFEAAVADLKKLGEHIASLPPTEILSTVVAGAVKLGASDVHVEPTETEARLRYRIDGVLQDISTFEREGWKILLSRVKVLAQLKLNVRDTPQDGSFVLRVGERAFDIRVSILPGGDGENIVMRLLDRATRVYSITELGMKERDFVAVSQELKRSNGMVLVTGPTGSGKTTSLASFLATINRPEFKIITLEDPIEYRLEGIEQTQVDPDAGYTFAKGLRAILRQDPDVIMVGEIRDTETAETAMHASLTGHLVLSTLHTNDAPGAVPRLVDMGVQPFILAPAVNIIIAQRLVRVVCKKCREEYRPDAALLEKLKGELAGVVREIFDPTILQDKKLVFYRAKGCSECRTTGYRGRVGAFEVMVVTGEIEELVLKGADSSQLRAAALKAGMTTILQDAYLKVIAGITTLEEVERVTEA